MPTPNPLVAEWSRGGGPRLATLGSLSETWIVPTVDGISPVTDLVAGNLVAFIYAKKVWLRDDTDHTTPNDGITCIVTYDSVRFKSTAVVAGGVYVWPVIDFQNAPPAGPSAGDTYGVGNAPSGAWAANAKAIATCLVGGGSPSWAFTPAAAGMLAYDKSQSIFRSVNASVAWVDGLQSSYATGSIPAEALVFPLFVVQSQTATPPGSPTAGQYWLVGASATGAWAGQDNKVAKCTNATGPVWSFFSPSTGYRAFNLTTIKTLAYIAGAWTSVGNQILVGYPARVIRSAAITLSGSSPGQATAPTSASGALIFPEGSSTLANYTLQKSTNRLLIKLRVDFAGIADQFCFAVFIDGEVTCRTNNWVCDEFSNGVAPADFSRNYEFEIAVGDTSGHTYNVRGYEGGASVLRSYMQFVEIDAS